MMRNCPPMPLATLFFFFLATLWWENIPFLVITQRLHVWMITQPMKQSKPHGCLQKKIPAIHMNSIGCLLTWIRVITGIRVIPSALLLVTVLHQISHKQRKTAMQITVPYSIGCWHQQYDADISPYTPKKHENTTWFQWCTVLLRVLFETSCSDTKLEL